MSTVSDGLKARARRLVEEVLSQGDLAVAGELVAEDYVHHVPGRQPSAGVAGLKEIVALMHRTFPDFHVTVEDEIAEGDRVVQRMTIRGTARLGAAGSARPAPEVSLCAVDINRAGPDGRFVEHWSTVDLLGLVDHLGDAPTESAHGVPAVRDQEK